MSKRHFWGGNFTPLHWSALIFTLYILWRRQSQIEGLRVEGVLAAWGRWDLMARGLVWVFCGPSNPIYLSIKDLVSARLLWWRSG